MDELAQRVRVVVLKHRREPFAEIVARLEEEPELQARLSPISDHLLHLIAELLVRQCRQDIEEEIGIVSYVAEHAPAMAAERASRSDLNIAA
jgi:hypothetical protein